MGFLFGKKSSPAPAPAPVAPKPVNVVGEAERAAAGRASRVARASAVQAKSLLGIAEEEAKKQTTTGL